MKTLTLSCAVFLLVTAGWTTPGVGEQGLAPQGELRIVDKHPWNWAWITFNVFEHLMELDKDGTLCSTCGRRGVRGATCGATVVSKMLEQVDLQVDLQLLDQVAYQQKVFISALDQPPERQPWDIALAAFPDVMNFPVFQVYQNFALDGGV
jgi:hypothetical protein